MHRSILSKTIEVFGRYDGWRQSDTLPVSLSLLGAVEGLDNMTEHHQPTIAATISRAFGSRLVLYTTPAFVWNTAAADFLAGHDEHDHDGVGEPEVVDNAEDNTLLLGLGGRLRLRPSVFVTGEFTPRLDRLRSGGPHLGLRAREEDRRPHAADQLHELVRHDLRPAGAARQRARRLSRLQRHPFVLTAGTAAGGPFHRERVTMRRVGFLLIVLALVAGCDDRRPSDRAVDDRADRLHCAR